MVDPDFSDKELQETFKQKWENCKKKLWKLQIRVKSIEGNESSYEHLKEVREILRNPLDIWKNENTDIKQLLLKVMFNWNLQYQKNQGLRTPDFSFPLWDRDMSDTEFTWMWIHSGSNLARGKLCGTQRRGPPPHSKDAG